MTPAAALNRVFEPIHKCLSVSVARKIVGLRADEDLRQRLQELGERSNDGKLSDDERAEYESYVRAFDLISILQSKARAILAQSRKKR